MAMYNRKHGMKNTPEYRAYIQAKIRCTHKNRKQWKDYGGRGIEFRFATFSAFLEHIGPKPSPEYTIDRIDSDGHYEVGNVRWLAREEQPRNRRNCRNIEINGRTQTLAEWCRELGLRYNTVQTRIQRLGWDEKRALGLNHPNTTVSQLKHP